MRLTIEGPPRTKKTSQRVLRRKNGTPFVMPSERSAAWEESATFQLRGQLRRVPSSIIGVVMLPYYCCPVSVCALIYRDADRGDLTGYLQAIGDALERAGVVTNDKLIHSWDGSRKLIDRARPRVEIEIGPLP